MKLQTRAGLLTLSLVPTIVLLNGKPFTVTSVQQRLLAPLVAAGGGFVSTPDLIAAAWLHEGTSGRTVSSHLSDLRRKLARLGLRIEAFRGRGYALAFDTSPRPCRKAGRRTTPCPLVRVTEWSVPGEPRSFPRFRVNADKGPSSTGTLQDCGSLTFARTATLAAPDASSKSFKK
jgi:DNA-binding winged helix-turn-helix (wHTH) protein